MSNVELRDEVKHLAISEDLQAFVGTDRTTTALVDAEADIETAGIITLAGNEALALAYASTYGRIYLQIFGDTVTGSPSFTIDSLSGSVDGTNYRIIQSFAPVSITAAGEIAGPEVTAPIPADITKLRLDITVTTLDGTNDLNMYLALRLEA